MAKPDRRDETPTQKIRKLKERAQKIADNPTYGSPQELAAVTVELAAAVEEVVSVIQPEDVPTPTPQPADEGSPFPPHPSIPRVL